MRLRTLALFLAVGWTMASTAFVSATEPVREFHSSPDKKYLVAWFDQDVGGPLGQMRSVILCASDDSAPLFSFVSNPRYTDTAWNASSDRCIIVDAPDNGGPAIWLLEKTTHGDWNPRQIDPFASLSAEFYNKPADPAKKTTSVFRPSILKIEWLTTTKVRFRGYCNLGTYFMTMDAANPDKAPEVEKLSDKLLKE